MDIRAVGEMGLGGKPFQLHDFKCAVSAKRLIGSPNRH